MTDKSLYRYNYSAFNGYIVYRHVFDETRCELKDGIRMHKVAEFVCEMEAQDYCDYRNYMTKKHGTDDITKIKWKTRTNK